MCAIIIIYIKPCLINKKHCNTVRTTASDGVWKMAYFPMYIDISGKKCLVVGGGAVARRKVSVLNEFGANITVVAPDIDTAIAGMAGVGCREKEFEETDLEGCTLVIAATDNKDLNRMIAEKCRERGIFVNAVDQIEDCGFIFPAILKQGNIVASFSTGGKSPAVSQLLKREMEDIMTGDIEKAADFLGLIRPFVKKEIKPKEKRKCLYKDLLAFCLEHHRRPSQDEIEKIIMKYK